MLLHKVSLPVLLPFKIDCQKTFDTQSIVSALFAFTFAVEINDTEIMEKKTIGRLIEEEVRRQGKNITAFADEICCTRSNVYNIFDRKVKHTNRHVQTMTQYRDTNGIRTTRKPRFRALYGIRPRYRSFCCRDVFSMSNICLTFVTRL